MMDVGWVDGRMDGWTEGWMDREMEDEWMIYAIRMTG